ncbi:unnamed protein product [Caenorhabditis auriculariae]|uniref:C2H2-type domain-containing protein n=1 Tax=Caenorhabditis auriculariae TaxID=2777116 RepID=A0A8S1H0J9_9PELO|nr:unnamed protein product [Caenorhabditis auriculariae]
MVLNMSNLPVIKKWAESGQALRRPDRSPTEIAMGSPSPPLRKKKPYKELTLEQKVELIRLAETNSALSQASIADRYAIAKSNVCRISATERGVPQGLPQREILSNESLRTHMYKHHRISRMFMCRCCNWAFSDKTSLHEHVQNIKEGKIASNKPLILPTASESTSAPTSVIRAPVSLQSPLNSLFSLSGDLRERFLLTQLLVQQSQLFPAPLPNPFVPSLESVKIQRNSTEIETEAKERSFEGVRPDSGLSLSDEDASNCSIKNFHASPSSSRSEPSAFQPLQKLSMCPSPTPSATNTSSASTSSPSSVSPQESSACFECEDLRTKVKAAESRTSFLEAQVEVLKTELAQTRSQLSVSELAVSNSQMETQLLRQHNEMFQRRLLECQALAVQFLQSGIERTPSAADVAGLLNQIVAATIVR